MSREISQNSIYIYIYSANTLELFRLDRDNDRTCAIRPHVPLGERTNKSTNESTTSREYAASYLNQKRITGSTRAPADTLARANTPGTHPGGGVDWISGGSRRTDGGSSPNGSVAEKR